MLSGLCINEEKQKACVEELSIEYSICDGRLLLTLGVLADPVNQVDDDQLEDDVHTNDDECDGLSDDFGPNDVVEVLQANGSRVDDIAVVVFLLVYFVLGNSLIFFLEAETLHCARKMRFLLQLLCQVILLKLDHCVLLPQIVSAAVILGHQCAVDLWILLLLGQGGLRTSENDRKGDGQRYDDDYCHNNSLEVPLFRREVSILPNDIGWL